MTKPEIMFWDRVGPEDERGCWPWIGDKNGGYGRFECDDKKIPAHRFAYALLVGPIPDGLYVCHHCDNTACVNPKHLYAGTQAENVADMWRRGRSHDRRGIGNSRAQLSERDVLEIRAAYAAGGITQRELSQRYRVCPSDVCHIITRKSWRHLE
jgi:hypothetical protein